MLKDSKPTRIDMRIPMTLQDEIRMLHAVADYMERREDSPRCAGDLRALANRLADIVPRGEEPVAWQYESRISEKQDWVKFASTQDPRGFHNDERFLRNVRPLYPHPPADNVHDQEEVVIELAGIDEYGPQLKWHKHWTDFPIGTKFKAVP